LTAGYHESHFITSAYKARPSCCFQTLLRFDGRLPQAVIWIGIPWDSGKEEWTIPMVLYAI